MWKSCSRTVSLPLISFSVVRVGNHSVRGNVDCVKVCLVWYVNDA